MRWIRYLFALAAVGACSGNGGEIAPSPGGASLQQQRLVVQYDQNGDGEPDVLTLDTTSSPYRIVEMVQGVTNGDPIDVTDVVQGQAFDAEISDALAVHVSESLSVGTRTELDVTDASGNAARVVVFR